jgi:transposase-like protein
MSGRFGWISADDVENCILKMAVNHGECVAAFCRTRNHRLTNRTRPIGFAQRPQHKCQDCHRGNADILTEPISEMAVARWIEKVERLLEMHAR